VTGRTLLAAIAAFFLAVAVSLASPAGPALASSAHGPFLELSVIHGVKTDGGLSIDPALRDLPQLTRDQPFVQYNSYKLLERRQFPLDASKPVVLPLPNGRTLQVTLGGVSVEKNEKRYQLEARIAEPGKQAFLKSLQVTTSENEPFFVGGQS
jgi:hypothetical protein